MTNHPTALPDFLSVEQMAEALGLAVTTIRNKHLAKLKATCKHAKIGRHVYIEKKGFDRYVRSMIKAPDSTI